MPSTSYARPLPANAGRGIGGDVSYLYAIAIGSNRPHGRFGRPTGVVEAAIARLDEEFGLFDSSPIILNAANGGAGRDFANAVALVESHLDPAEMLGRLKRWKASSAGAAASAGDRACSTSISPCGAAAIPITPADHSPPSACLPNLCASAARGDRAGLARGDPEHPSSRPPPCPQGAVRLTARQGGPIAQLVEQLTFNQ